MWRMFLGALITECASMDPATYTHHLATEQASQMEGQQRHQLPQPVGCRTGEIVRCAGSDATPLVNKASHGPF